MNPALAHILELAQSRRPDFGNLLAVLQRRVPVRPTLFEFTLNAPIYEQVTGRPAPADGDGLGWARYLIEAFGKLGYDFAVIGGWHHRALVFAKGSVDQKASKSLNSGAVITNEDEFAAYRWPILDASRLAFFEKIGDELPDGMRLIACGYEGVLETVIDLVGFENLCLMLYLQPKLVEAIFANVGARILSFYEQAVQYDAVGAVIANDDWGFKTQTMLSPDDLRRLVFPWHRKIVEAAHAAGKPVILHSCGNLAAVLDDIIDDLQVDGKHSYEDAILPVEKAIELYGRRLAIIGGIDVDFLAKQPPEAIRARTRRLVETAMTRGGIALGSGNSIPEYVPTENFCAMLESALDFGC